MSAPYPVLYSFRRCPYAMRARLAIAASGLVCVLREVVLAHKPPALLLASAKGTVPVLVMCDGTVIDQSLDIMLWALQQSDPLQWLPRDGVAEASSLQWIAECDGPFKHQLDRYKYPHRYDLPDGLAYRAQGAAYLARLNQHITEQGFLAGPQAGLADMAIAPFVRQFAHVDPLWFGVQDWSALQGWLSAFETSALLERVMEKYPAWVEGQATVLFPTTAAEVKENRP
jgi:glutathione S-transferase